MDNNYVEIHRVWLIDLITLNGQAMKEYDSLTEKTRAEIVRKCPRINRLFGYVNSAESVLRNVNVKRKP